MKNWWENLAARERLMLSIALIITIIAVLYLLVWEPLQKRTETLRHTVSEERNQIAWMEQAAVEILALRGGVVPKEKRNNESLLAVVDRSARAAGMGAGINRVEPEGKDKARIWLNDVAFDNLIRWLSELDKTQGITTESVVIDRQNVAGQVNARLVLMGGGN